ncbi:hypothetical protein [Streptomyces sp. NPDC005732]|uniref:hypothetical protein n=1 Tax=Streptomyces sp. NPDC005732 TaxID=3157057 RepID=UPI0033EF7967
MNAEITTSVRSHTVSLGIEGAPNATNRYGPGWMRPTQVQITYWYDSADVEPDAAVRIFGMWVRENGDETGHVMDQAWLRRDWPLWVTELVEKHRP